MEATASGLDSDMDDEMRDLLTLCDAGCTAAEGVDATPRPPTAVPEDGDRTDAALGVGVTPANFLQCR